MFVCVNGSLGEFTDWRFLGMLEMFGDEERYSVFTAIRRYMIARLYHM